VCDDSRGRCVVVVAVVVAVAVVDAIPARGPPPGHLNTK
jgi:hypothetical protein